MNIKRLPTDIKNGLLRPPSHLEDTILIIAVFLNLLDSFTTLTFTLTRTGVELNPILKLLLSIDPFLVYPFLLTMLFPLLLFRFNMVAEYALALMLIIIYLTASLNNIGIITYRYSPILPTLGTLDIQFLAFLMGVTYIGGYTLFRCIKEKYNLINSIKMMSANYIIYLVAYLALNLIPMIWLSVLT